MTTLWLSAKQIWSHKIPDPLNLKAGNNMQYLPNLLMLLHV